MGFILHGLQGPAFYLAMGGLFSAWFIYMKKPVIAQLAHDKLAFLRKIMEEKYFFDHLFINVFAGMGRLLGKGLWKGGDVAVIDGTIVDGSAKVVGWMAGVIRHIQTGYLYHYAFAMILGLLGLLSWVLFGSR